MSFYVYLLFKADGTPYYVGKGMGRRCHRTVTDSGGARSNPFKARVFRKVGRLIVEKIAEFEDESEAFLCERDLIAKLGRYPYGPLTNLTEGGEGFTGGRHSEEVRGRMGDKRRGVKLSPAHVEAIRRGLTGLTYQKMSQQTKDKISATNRVKVFSDEHRARLRDNKLAYYAALRAKKKITDYVMNERGGRWL